MAEIYDAGDIVRLEAVFQTLGELSDPATVALVVTSPAGVATTYTWAGTDVVRVSLGSFRYDLTLASNAAPGLWRYTWATTGSPATSIRGFFEVRAEPLVELVRRLRRTMHDTPQRAYLGAGLDSTELEAVLSDAADAKFFPATGITFEFDDGTDEVCRTTAPAVESGPTVAIRRGEDGTTGNEHAVGAAMLLNPDFNRMEILDAAQEVVDLEMWPFVWQAGEFALPDFTTGTELYSPPVPNITEIVYAYQYVNGLKYSISVEWIPSTIAHDSYPGGALGVLDAFQSEPVYVAYRAKPALGSLSSELTSLLGFGVRYKLQQLKEAQKARESASWQQGQQPGASIRAGIVMQQNFESARARLMASLAGEEGRRKADLRRSR